MRTRFLTIPVFAFLVPFTGCAGMSQDEEHFAQPWLNDIRLRQWEKLDAVKMRVNRDSDEPQMQEFKGAGTMFVWKHSLDGGPGWEYVRIAYSYKNTEEHKFDWIRVWGEILDSDGRVVHREEELLIHPLGYAIAPGDTWSDVMKLPTKGVHNEKGWDWRIGCEPVYMRVLAPKRRGG